MLNIEKYKEKILERYRKGYGSLADIVEKIMAEDEPETYKRICGERILTTDVLVEWLTTEYVEPILNKKEMTYLTGVMNPFIEHVDYVMKKEIHQDYEYICIMLEGVSAPFNLPAFRKGEMYKGMERDRKYNVADLGICRMS